MPKMKTVSGAKKRFKVTASGKLKRRKAFANHIMTKKSKKRKRNFRKATITSPANEKNIKRMLGI